MYLPQISKVISLIVILLHYINFLLTLELFMKGDLCDKLNFLQEMKINKLNGFFL